MTNNDTKIYCKYIILDHLLIHLPLFLSIRTSEICQQLFKRIEILNFYSNIALSSSEVKEIREIQNSRKALLSRTIFKHFQGSFISSSVQVSSSQLFNEKIGEFLRQLTSEEIELFIKSMNLIELKNAHLICISKDKNMDDLDSEDS